MVVSNGQAFKARKLVAQGKELHVQFHQPTTQKKVGARNLAKAKNFVLAGEEFPSNFARTIKAPTLSRTRH